MTSILTIVFGDLYQQLCVVRFRYLPIPCVSKSETLLGVVWPTL